MSDHVVTLSDQYDHSSMLKYGNMRINIISSLIPRVVGERAGSALDIGCAEGGFTKMLWEKGYESLGIDIDANKIEIAKQRFGAERLRFETQNATELESPDRSYDVVLCLEVVEHLIEPELLLAEIRRVIKPGGMVVISTPNGCSPEGLAGVMLQSLGGRKWNAWDPTHVTIFSSWRFMRLLRDNGLEPVRVVGCYYFPSIYRFKSCTFLNRVQGAFDFVRYAHCAQFPLNRFGFNFICVCVPRTPKRRQS